MRRMGKTSAWAALALAAVLAGPALAQTTVSGPITFATGLSVSGAGAVSIAPTQSGLTCSSCILSGTTWLPGSDVIDSNGFVYLMGASGADAIDIHNSSGTTLLTAYTTGSVSGSIGVWDTGTSSPRPLVLNGGGGDVGIGTASPGYTLDVEGGKVNASGGYAAGGTAGVSCTGAPSASFAVTDGIVTHC